VDSLAYASFAYSHSVIGSMSDLSAASVEDVTAFFKAYYAPNNAVMAIVGDVKTDEVIAKVKKYFEAIPAQPTPPAVDMTEPAPSGEKRVTIEDALARATRIDMSYVIPPGGSPDAEALSVLGTVLSSGRSSRFYKKVVQEAQLATNVNAGSQEARGPGLFRVIIQVVPGKSAAEAEKSVLDEIERIKAAAPEDWEIDKARTIAQRSAVGGSESSLSRAVQLSQYELFYNDPARINTLVARIKAVTAADVQRVAKQYLTKENRSVITTTPKSGAPARGGI
jgi:zinc protease